MEKSQTVTAEDLLSATVKYSNNEDANRTYDISANVNIRNGKVSSFDSGEVRKESSVTASGVEAVSTFSSYSDKSLNLSFTNVDADESKTILDAIHDFMANVKSNVNATPVKA